MWCCRGVERLSFGALSHSSHGSFIHCMLEFVEEGEKSAEKFLLFRYGYSKYGSKDRTGT